MKLQKFKQAMRSEKFRAVRKVVVLVVGTAVILVGVFLLFFPGPAFVVIPAGFGILAIEFDWARSWMRKVMEFLRPGNLKRFAYENSLSVALFALFLLCLVGQLLSGHVEYNQTRLDHGLAELALLKYLLSAHAVEATFENWESEFLQMGALVVLTVYLRQKGAADSQKLNGEKVGHAHAARKHSPWPVRRGGWVLRVYEHSLSLSLLALFLGSLLLHAAGGCRLYNEGQVQHGAATVSMVQYMGTARFWFESFQNWQSEFLSVGVLLVLSIFLRERGSPQSKQISAPYFQTAGQEPAVESVASRKH